MKSPLSVLPEHHPGRQCGPGRAILGCQFDAPEGWPVDEHSSTRVGASQPSARYSLVSPCNACIVSGSLISPDQVATAIALLVLFAPAIVWHPLIMAPGGPMALRDSMRDSASAYLLPGEPVQAVFGAQTASQWLAALTGIFVFLGLNRYRIVVATPQRIVVLDAGRSSMKKARSVVVELPRSTRLGPATGLWHVIPAGTEKLRVHRRFFKDIETADNQAAVA
jgi:hypothetical protein